MCVPSLLTQGLVRKKQFDGLFTQKQDAASNSNMEAVLAMKITLTQKKNAINDAHLKVRSFCLFIFLFDLLLCFLFLFLCYTIILSHFLKFHVLFFKLLQLLSFTSCLLFDVFVFSSWGFCLRLSLVCYGQEKWYTSINSASNLTWWHDIVWKPNDNKKKVKKYSVVLYLLPSRIAFVFQLNQVKTARNVFTWKLARYAEEVILVSRRVIAIYPLKLRFSVYNTLFIKGYETKWILLAIYRLRALISPILISRNLCTWLYM